MKTCSVCGQTYSDYIDFCFTDGAVLTEGGPVAVDEQDSAVDVPLPRHMSGALDVRTPVPRGRRRSLIGAGSSIPGMPPLAMSAEDAPPLPPTLGAAPEPAQDHLKSDLMPEPMAPIPSLSEPAPARPEPAQPHVSYVPPPQAAVEPAQAGAEPGPAVDVATPVALERSPEAAAGAPPPPVDERDGLPMLWIGLFAGGVVIVFIAIFAMLALGGVGVFAVSSGGGAEAGDTTLGAEPAPRAGPAETKAPPPPSHTEGFHTADPPGEIADSPAQADAEDPVDPVASEDAPQDGAEAQEPSPDEAPSEAPSAPAVSDAAGPVSPSPVDPAPVAAPAADDAVATAEPSEEDVSPWGVPDEGTPDVTFEARIESTPPGAAVRINGAERGKTPLTVSLEEGTYMVELLLSGYAKSLETLHVIEGLAPMQVTLTGLAATGPVMVVFPGRDGYALEVDGTPAGTLPARTTMSAGEHEFTVRGQAGVFTVTRDVVFGDGTPVVNLAE